jgi:hypothetical protein
MPNIVPRAHAFVAAEIDAYNVGEEAIAARLYPRLCADELLTADRGFCSWSGELAGGHRALCG